MLNIKKYFIIMALICAVFSVASCKSDDDGNSNSNDNGEQNSNENPNNPTVPSDGDEKKILWYDDETHEWKGLVIWKAENNLETMMLAQIKECRFYIIDSNGEIREDLLAETEINTQDYILTASLLDDTLGNSVILKWADIPGMQIRVKIFINGNTPMTIATQNGLTGPNVLNDSVNAEDFILRDGPTGNVNKAVILANCVNNINEDRDNYGDKICKEFPVVKVAKMEMTAYGKTFSCDIDWSDEKILDIYSGKVNIGHSYGDSSSGFDWRSELAFPFSPCIMISSSEGKYTMTTTLRDKCYWYKGNSSSFFFIPEDENSETTAISNSNSSIKVSVTSTTGKIFTSSTTAEELISLESYRFQ